MIIDAHAHVWPDHLASRALAGADLGLELFGDGTATDLLAAQDRAGIDRTVTLAVANTPEQVDGANRFAGSLDRDRFIPFGSVHARLSAEANVASLRANRLRGAKVHPLFQSYSLDDPGLWETFDAMQGEFAVICHVGEGSHEGAGARCTPPMLAEVVKRFPSLDLIACHFGGYRLIEEAAEIVIGLPVYVDTSWPPSFAGLGRDRTVELIRRHGADRVIFASDGPTADPAAEIAVVRDLGLGDDETDAILGGNLDRLLGLGLRA